MDISGYRNSLCDTPCIGVCSTTQFGEKRCKGCGRFDFEVSEWNSLRDQEKKQINMRNWGNYPIAHRGLTPEERTLLMERNLIKQKLEGKEKEIYEKDLIVEFTIFEGENKDDITKKFK